VRAEVLGHQLAEAQGRIRALEAPKEPEPRIEPAPVPEPLTSQPNGQASAPWWRRWWVWALL
jgi:hypothetical protein